MAEANTALQTIIVPKDVYPTLREAEAFANRFKTRSIYTSRETEDSWRFRMRPPEDFKPNSYYTIKVGKATLVYGELK